MTRIFLFVIITMALTCCNNTERGERMHTLLVQAKMQNENHIHFTTDSAVMPVADYYAKHGTIDEQVLSQYILGCVYRDMGEAPKALQCYHNAMTRAEGASGYRNYLLLSKICGQMAMLFEIISVR